MTHNDEVRPLPVPVRPFDGETVDSYAGRLSAANFSTIEDIEEALVQRGQLGTRRRDHPERVQVWRVLGATHPRMFTTPKVVGGEWVTERVLCRKCTRGQAARGLLPAVGQVCLRHRRWLGHPQTDVPGETELLRAEAKFRTRLVPRGVMFDSLVMAEALRCAISSCDPDRTRDKAQDGLAVEAVLYPSQVAFADFMCSPGFLEPTGQRSKAVLDARRRRIHEIAIVVTRDAPDPEPERAVARLQHVAYTLDRYVTNNPRSPGASTDDPWNLLRHISS